MVATEAFITNSRRISPPPESNPRGAEILLHSLCAEGVDTIFGYPGGAALHIYDEIWRFRDRVTHYLARHEQGATHAADGYARATGKPGVVLVTSGPGATNTVTGLATAYMDSVPMVVITGQVPMHLIGTDAFQEVDTIGITMPCVKHNYLVRRVEDIAAVVREAFHLATTGRPGPVLIDIPKDITAARANFSSLERISFPLTARRWPPAEKDVKAAADALLQAKRPVLYVGGGIVTADAGAELQKLAETLEIPVTPTLMGLGGFPSAHPLCLGMLGMHGTWAANHAVAESDLLIAVGVRFDDRVTGKLATFAPRARVLHIDIDPANVGKNVAPELTIVADAKDALAALNQEITSRGETVEASRAAWWEQVRGWQREQPLRYEGAAETIKPQAVLRELSRLTDGKALIVTDVGQHQMWAAQFYPYQRARQWITSGGLGTMGFGLPAAMGAKLALPDKTVIAIVGDGGFQMTNQELATAAQYGIAFKVLIMNNGYLGMVRQWQEMFYERAYSEVDLSVAPDFVKLAEAYGVAGFRAKHPAELRERLIEWLAAPGVAVLDVVVAKEENVFPIVPPGGDANRMLVQAEG
jgi:acetolactate synthase-1/2/3 large subunit